MSELEALLILNAIPGIGNVTIRKLVQFYGSAAKIFTLNKSDFLSIGVLSENIISNIITFPKDTFLQKEKDLINKNNINLITFQDQKYPINLKEIPDAPVILYVKGEIPSNNQFSIAIVGCRKASLYGLNVARQFSLSLTECGFVIVSGMARGIDTAAHQGALKGGGMTLAVLGCGLSHIYPPENGKLLEEIASSGAVMSEFPMETPPIAYNFPRRNRIISGLSLGVVIVEAAAKSGALITADCALEQGREVFAIPGKIDSLSSRGVNDLIKQGAKLVTCVEDILEELKVPVSICLQQKDSSQGMPETESSLDFLTEQEKMIFNRIGNQPIHIDQLNDLCGSGVPFIMSVLLKLELRRLIKQIPGKLFVRCAAG